MFGLLAACSPAPSHESVLVNDNAALLQAGQRRQIEAFHRLLLADHDIDYRIVTANTSDIDAYSVERFEQLGVGQLSRSGRGLLLLVDPGQDRVRLEVGYVLEGTYPDAFVAYLEHRQMVPFFRAGRIADGILATTELIVTRAQHAAVNAAFDSEIWFDGSGGAGATVRARLNAGRDASFRDTETRVGAGTSPSETLRHYMAAMKSRNANPALSIYTPATQRMLENWVVTPAQMDNVVKAYRHCSADTERIDSNASHAVIRYPVEQRQCAPWFFENIDGNWALDLTMMQTALRFGRDNSWHFVPDATHAYGFAFTDWVMDAHGYPHKGRNH